MDSRLTLAAGISERELVRHLRSGGVVYMLVDFPRERSGGFSADLFGRRMSFNSFPFKLALRYDAPVFFVCLERSGNGGYRLSVEPLGPFETPDEGGSKYVSRLQTRLAAYPFMWLFLPNFTGWFSDAPPHDPPRRSGPVAP
jgi:lauroyl/myristoyl acyltransferase